MIDVEAYILFLTCVVFTVLWALRDFKSVLFGIFSAVSWLVMGMMWIFLVSEAPTYSTFSVALLYTGFGIVIIVVLIVQRFERASSKRLMEEEQSV
jgi:hypothetical protein